MKEIVESNRLPRRIELQHDLKRDEKTGKVEHIKFEESFEGIIESHAFHYKDSVDDIYPVWIETAKYFRL